MRELGDVTMRELSLDALQMVSGGTNSTTDGLYGADPEAWTIPPIAVHDHNGRLVGFVQPTGDALNPYEAWDRNGNPRDGVSENSLVNFMLNGQWSNSTPANQTPEEVAATLGIISLLNTTFSRVGGPAGPYMSGIGYVAGSGGTLIGTGVVDLPWLH